MCKGNLKIAAIVISALILAAQVTRVINAEGNSQDKDLESVSYIWSPDSGNKEGSYESVAD